MYVRSPRSTGGRPSAVFHAVWITTVALVIFDLSGDKSTIRSFFAPRTISDIVLNQVESVRVFANKSRDSKSADVVPSVPSEPHEYFALETPEKTENKEKEAVNINLAGQWTGAVHDSDVEARWTSGDCMYEVRSLDFQLRSSGEQVYGKGSYSLRSEECGEGSSVTHYASVTGKISSPYLKLVARNDKSGQTEIIYYGTIRPEGIVGQVRSAYGELLAEHVMLIRH